MEPLVELRSVGKSFPLNTLAAASPSQASTKTALLDIDLTLRQGERIGIVGPNGAGKSTLLHIIAGLSSATSGTLRVTGQVTSILTLGVGLREDLTGRENIYVDGEIHNRSRQATDSAAEEVIAFSELGEFIDYPVRTYSTGMKARLAFALISHINPEILLIDEALSVGDASFSAKATARIKEICERGKIVIIVSHSMEAVRSMCNRCIWLQDGKVVLDGTPDTVTSAYIDSVRKADDAQLIRRFRKSTGNRSLQSGWQVDRVTLCGGARLEQRTLLETLQPCAVKIRASVPAVDERTRLRVRITRVDDTVLFDETFASTAARLDTRTLALEIEMPALLLGVAVYRLDVFLEQGATLMAQDSQVFEVFSAQVPIGGKPMLYVPVFSTVTRPEVQP